MESVILALSVVSIVAALCSIALAGRALKLARRAESIARGRTWVVPDGVNEVTVETFGAGGGGASGGVKFLRAGQGPLEGKSGAGAGGADTNPTSPEAPASEP